ncbi:hypothetical protein GS429_18390 [Natronorubrum sp. JWXQ-INN-674]|uniref:Uncharacterized protein n=1 Tax=Natronorubrum halalkaliphilum TaxID=2691917 RepID=A0A6B0VRM8_9EURY|nr:hypothetical protein [Natronorubrum halalkaliphilum]MXV63995.1 hypothetical protein [Natronorubrum halalkaliphilum]
MFRDNSSRDTDRGQAYTLEGFISAMIVLMALLFAMQSVVITPTTGGLADRTVQSQIQQEAQDALVVAAMDDEGDLSEMIRYWDEDEDEFYNATESSTAPGSYNATNNTELYNEFALGEILSDRFTERGLSYNVELVYQNESGEFDSENSTYLVYQGESEAVVASYTVTLFETDDLKAPASSETVDGADSYPVPRATDSSSAVYNVVEVRIAVW